MIEYLKILMVEYRWFTYIISFILGIITDVIWSWWSISVTKRHALTSANLSVFIYIIGLLYTLLIIESQLIPICLYIFGGWLGTFLTVRTLK